MYGTPIKNAQERPVARSSYKFFENYNFKCLMDELRLQDKENVTSGNKATGRKGGSPVSHYKYIYKILHTSTVLRQSPASAKRQAVQKLSSIASLDCMENLNSRFDNAEAADLNLNARNAGFTRFIEHMREDATYAGYFETPAPAQDKREDSAQPRSLGAQCRTELCRNVVSKLSRLVN